ncbi:MAG: nucleotidyltransferase domain-containing protein [Chitinophagaceae bacterium]
MVQIAVFTSPNESQLYLMLEEINKHLRQIEIAHDISVLYACESGSRAWGFPSPDSDYDVRFIYRRELTNYLTIKNRRDVIEVPVNEIVDISGWDIRKALQLFLKSNAPLYEWLQSPVNYKNDSSFLIEMNTLMPEYFSLRAGCHHYLSMANNTFEKDLQSPSVNIKKYFYTLRSALAALWIVENKTVPPMQFAELRIIIKDDQWQSIVDGLLEKKKSSNEKTFVIANTCLQEWINNTLPLVERKIYCITRCEK